MTATQPELGARRAQLRQRAEERAYRGMTAGMGAAEPVEAREGTFASYRAAVGLGGGVFVSLFTAAGAGYFAAQTLSRDPSAVSIA